MSLAEPPQTCPIINSVAQRIENEDLTLALEYLEDVRRANGDLRAWGRSLEKTVENLENDLKEANNKIEKKDREVDYLQRSVEALSKELSGYQNH